MSCIPSDPNPANGRYRSVVDVYVLLHRDDGKVLLLERANTGYADGQLCPPSGHLEAGESVVDGALREANEEVGVVIDPADLWFAHVVHYRNSDSPARIGFFFATRAWSGTPVNREPHKCAGLLWADPTNLPPNTVPYTAFALGQIAMGVAFSTCGW